MELEDGKYVALYSKEDDSFIGVTVSKIAKDVELDLKRRSGIEIKILPISSEEAIKLRPDLVDL